MTAKSETEMPMNVTGQANSQSLYSVCAAVFVISAAATVYFCRSMSGGMPMPGGWTMTMMWMRMPGQSWAGAAIMFLYMWLAMMVAMMLPSVMPMLVNYQRGLLEGGSTQAGWPTALVAGGYFFVWLVAGALVYPVCVGFAEATMRSTRLSQTVPVLTGAALVLAGCMQFTSWKMCGLGRCRNSENCVVPGACGSCGSAWRHGLGQGWSCFVCCAGPMLAMLVLGAMDLKVMIGVAVVIALEKLLPRPEWFVRASGAIAVIVGVGMMLRAGGALAIL